MYGSIGFYVGFRQHLLQLWGGGAAIAIDTSHGSDVPLPSESATLT